MLFQLAAHFEIGGAHGEAQGPGLGAAGDDAAVVVGEHHQGPAPQGGIEGRFAGGIEVVAIDQHDRHPGCRPGSGIGRLLRGPWIGAAPRGCGGGEGREGHGCLGWRGLGLGPQPAQGAASGAWGLALAALRGDGSHGSPPPRAGSPRRRPAPGAGRRDGPPPAVGAPGGG